MITSIKADKKSFWQNSASFCHESINKIAMKEMYLNIIQAKYDKLRALLIFNGERLKAFPLRSGTGQRCPFSPIFPDSTGSPSQKKVWKRKKASKLEKRQ